MRKRFLRLGSIFGMLAVMIGAFGAHGLKPHISAEAYANFDTAVKYHFVHAIAILGIAALLHFGRKKTLALAAWLMAAGIIAFSGSLYILATREIHGISASWLGPVTPLGGVLFIGGWIALFMSTFYHYERHYKEHKEE